MAKDWDLTLFSKQEAARSEHIWGLRRRLVFRVPTFYYLIIALNCALRFSWVLSLLPLFDIFTETEGGIFVMVGMEIFRRWLWAFLRVEAEWSRAQSPVSSTLLMRVQSEQIKRPDQNRFLCRLIQAILIRALWIERTRHYMSGGHHQCMIA